MIETSIHQPCYVSLAKSEGTLPKTKEPSNMDSAGDLDRNFKRESRRNKKLRFCKSRTWQ
jgi:hypothetical protein